jgi:outer membrane lipoprotein carrier protein
MTMKQLSLLLLVAVCSLQSWCQNKLTAEQQKQIIEKIDKAASAVTSMQCDFTQTKRMKLLSKDMQSKGVMYFKRPDKLRWQYTSPYDYTFILNGDKVHLKSAHSTQNINVQGNKMFRQITSIILNSITGAGLQSTSDFNVELYQIPAETTTRSPISPSGYFAKLYPKKKEVRQVYNVIEIYFNQSLTMVSSVKMIEKTGDVTLVNLTNVKPNAVVNEKLFDTH